MLLHLEQLGVTVSTPVSRKDGSYVSTVQAPEGPRHVILLTYAPGELPNQVSGVHSYQHGRALAVIHNCTDGFVSTHEREAIDLDYLIDRPLKPCNLYSVSDRTTGDTCLRSVLNTRDAGAARHP